MHNKIKKNKNAYFILNYVHVYGQRTDRELEH